MPNPADTATPDESNEQQLELEKLKSALWYSIGQMVDHEAIDTNTNATPQFIGALTEMVWHQIAMASVDLERFAKHANRKTINTDDVLLLCRRNEGLESLMASFIDHIQHEHADHGPAPAAGSSKRRK